MEIKPYDNLILNKERNNAETDLKNHSSSKKKFAIQNILRDNKSSSISVPKINLFQTSKNSDSNIQVMSNNKLPRNENSKNDFKVNSINVFQNLNNQEKKEKEYLSSYKYSKSNKKQPKFSDRNSESIYNNNYFTNNTHNISNVNDSYNYQSVENTQREYNNSIEKTPNFVENIGIIKLNSSKIILSPEINKEKERFSSFNETHNKNSISSLNCLIEYVNNNLDIKETIFIENNYALNFTNDKSGVKQGKRPDIEHYNENSNSGNSENNFINIIDLNPVIYKQEKSLNSDNLNINREKTLFKETASTSLKRSRSRGYNSSFAKSLSPNKLIKENSRLLSDFPSIKEVEETKHINSPQLKSNRASKNIVNYSNPTKMSMAIFNKEKIYLVSLYFFSKIQYI